MLILKRTIIAVLLLVVTLFFFFFINIISAGKVREAIGQEKIVRHGEVELHYNVSGNGRKIVLIASAGRPASDFNELVETLNSSNFSTISFEHRGIKNNQGLNDKNINIFDLAEDIKAVIENETAENERVILIGHAFGNRVVRAYASLYDDKVSNLILIQSGGQAPPQDQKAVKALTSSFSIYLPKFWRVKKIKYAFFSDSNDVPRHWISGWYGFTGLMQGRALKNTNIERYIAGGSSPMLIIHGKNDRIATTENAILLKEKLQDRVKLVLVDNMGHAALPENPKIISESILNFLN